MGLFMRMRVVALLSGSIIGSAPALADSGTYFVIPGRPDVPVIVNGYGFDASYTVVEGDFGLGKPVQVNPIIITGPHIVRPPASGGYYFPSGGGRTPGYGRLEVQPSPDRRLPAPAQSYSRSWGTSSDPLPASTDPPYPLTIEPYVGVGPWGPSGPRGPRRGGGGPRR